jgi:hypothetical protein
MAVVAFPRLEPLAIERGELVIENGDRLLQQRDLVRAMRIPAEDRALGLVPNPLRGGFFHRDSIPLDPRLQD